jgi:hypothetical protein
MQLGIQQTEPQTNIWDALEIPTLQLPVIQVRSDCEMDELGPLRQTREYLGGIGSFEYYAPFVPPRLESEIEHLTRLFLPCDFVSQAQEIIRTYISESERNRVESWKRWCRKHIRSSAVSKNGHLSFLSRHIQICLETAARDQVVHLEVITLAEEQEARNSSASGQMQTLGGSLWKTLQSALRNLVAVPIYLSSTN